MAAGAIVEDGTWLGRLHDELRGLLAPVFAQARSRLTAFAYIGALLAEPGDRRSCWQLAEAAGHATPRRMQALLAEHAWDWTAALAALQQFILARLGDPGAIVVLDETAELKKGDRTVGVARQHAGITGQVENCQTVVFMAYVEECHQQGKGQTGLDQHQVRTWHSFNRHTVLSMCAQAMLAVAAARPAPPAAEPPVASMAGQPEAWRDTSKLPATAGDQPPGDDPGLVKVSVPEARRLLRLATAPMSRAARDLGYAWSRWRRRHQARARWHHYHAQLKAARVTRPSPEERRTPCNKPGL